MTKDRVGERERAAKREREGERASGNAECSNLIQTISAFSSNRSYHLHDNSRNGNMEIY